MTPKEYPGKPYYSYIELPDLKNPIKNPMTTRGEYGNIYQIIYSLRVKDDSKLHIGTGLVKPSEDPDKETETGIDFIRDSKNKPIIPGSTIKGYARDKFETLVKGSCWISNNSRRDVPPACDGKDQKLCPCCDLFGVNKIQGRVQFSDAILSDSSFFEEKMIKIPRLMGPKPQKYISGTKKIYKYIPFGSIMKNCRDNIWIVEPGAIFKGNFTIINSSLLEVRKLIISMFNFYPGFTAIMGHGKNLGLGHLELHTLSIQMKTNPLASFKRHLVDMKNPAKDIFFKRPIDDKTFRWDVLETIQKMKNGITYPEI